MEDFLDKIMITDFLLSRYIELNSASAKPRFFGAAKQHLGVIIILPSPHKK